MTLTKIVRNVIPAVVLALGAPGAVFADLVTNGDFEANTPAGGKQTFAGNVTGWSGGVSPGPTNLTYLVAPGNATSNPLPVYGPFPATSPVGGNFVEADGEASYAAPIYQTITGLVAGQQYAVTFYQAAGQQQDRTGPTTEQWSVGLGDTLAASQATAQLSSLYSLPQGGVGPWQAQTIIFTADVTGSEVLSFLAKGTPAGAPPILFLDGVHLNAVPEPSSMLLIGIGLVGSAAVRRFRGRKAAAV